MNRYCWSRLSAAKWEDAWRESLLYLGPERMAVFVLPQGDRIRVELYNLREAEAAALVGKFGGRARRQAGLAEQLAARAPRAPIRIRRRLTSLDEEAPLPADATGRLHIPAGMAFGTGDHATTASCLRLLADSAAGRKKWSMLDLGTGSGILALAARSLGAAPVAALDYDADAVRVARENAARNRLEDIAFSQGDVTAWKPRRKFDVVAANLFAQVLIEAAPAIARAVRPAGRLILSGILRAQEEETVSVFEDLGLKPHRTVRRGKWIATVLTAAAR